MIASHKVLNGLSKRIKENGARLRVLVVFGTRPEAIKLAPVVRELQQHAEQVRVRTCATAQHREMLDQVTRLFGIVPDIDLDLMRPEQRLSELGARVLMGLDPVLAAERPDWVLVQGDTTTVMMAALAAQHRQVRVGHVEAGLRTGDRLNPFPEEMNRVVADHISDLCFAPTATARRNLLQEGIPNAKIRVTGNTVIDALLDVAARDWSPCPPSPLQTIAKRPSSKRMILVTAHRRENFGQPLRAICQALKQIARRGDVHIVYPVHPNPNVQRTVHRLLGRRANITLLPPVDYQELIYLMKRCVLVLTDSGGLQEEAPSLGKPVLVLRAVTERPEAVEAGVARVVGMDAERIVSNVSELLDDPQAYAAMARGINPYGDGHAAERIVRALIATT
jgi:UDP-N-acetylglucosamine 2-epimerase (non-hydrolysing)